MIVADDTDDYVGEIRIYAGIQEPEGWMFCDGREVSAQSYPQLAHALGYVWGGGGHRFRIPDLRGRLTVGEGKGTGMTQRILGQSGGAETCRAPLPIHGHAFQASRAPATDILPANRVHAAVVESGATRGLYLLDNGALQDMAVDAVVPVGRGQPHDNCMPTVALNYIICVKGSLATGEGAVWER